LQKNSVLNLILGGAALILGGAALQRCGKCTIFNPALAAEVAVCCPGMSFPQPLQPRRQHPKFKG
jgi:hypothetical protein